MDLVTLLNGLVAQLADAQKAADDLAKTKYDEGFAAGVASMPPPSVDPLQVQLDAAMAQIASLQAQIEAIPEQLHQAALAEDAALAVKVKALLDGLMPVVS